MSDYNRCVAAEAFLLQVIELLASTDEAGTQDAIVTLLEIAFGNGLQVDLQAWWGGTLPEVLRRLCAIGFIATTYRGGFVLTRAGADFIRIAIAEVSEEYAALEPFLPMEVTNGQTH